MKRSRSELVRLRTMVFGAIAAAIGLRLASLLVSETTPGSTALASSLVIGAAALLFAATYYALRQHQHFPRFGWLVLIAITFVGGSHAFDFFIGASAPPSREFTSSATTLEFLRATLFLSGIGIALIGFYLSIFDLLEVREVQFSEQQRLTDVLREREQAEAALRASEFQLRKLFDGMDDAIFVHDFEGRIIEANDAASARMGYTRDEFLKMRTMDLDGPEFATGFQDRLSQQVAQKRYRCEGLHRTKTGRLIPVDVKTTLIEYHGKPAILAVIHDVSEQRKMEAERTALQVRVAQAEKLESLGVMAGGIAHDFNNLLMGVLGNASLALLDLPPGSMLRRNLEQIETSAQRAAHLSQQMLAYSGRATFAFKPVDLSSIVHGAEAIALQSISSHARVNFQYEDALPTIDGDRAQLTQVLISLVTNAAESYGDQGGEVSVRVYTQLVAIDTPRPARLTDSLHEGAYVVLEVTDHGMGMDEQTLDRIFDPFFTTKFTGRGLGLAAVMGIVRGHRGIISVNSVPKTGSTFLVYFPVKGAPRQMEIPRVAGDQELCARGVLVVDDEESVLSVASRALKRSGYPVFTARNGYEAIDVLREKGFDIAVVILDMTMPRISGEDTCNAIRTLREDVRIVLSSGYSQDDAVKRVDGVAIDGFLQKPYLPAELVRYVEQTLTGASAFGAHDFQV